VPDLADVSSLAAREHHLVVVSTVRADGTPQSSVVNAGVLPHPVTGTEVVAFVTYGKAKLAHLRSRPRLSIAVRVGWEWLAVEGTAEIAGPDDPLPGVDDERLRLLRREVFTAAGGTHDDWAAYDDVMASQRRAVVLVTPTRIYGNPLS
jgi:PPOX class probable F420-dependent enzyme